ncbi:N-acetylmuramic acid 6-phosphate etherase [Hymenobacter luteus]|uniref:N-acetylmuramic acid 6-phosphate etherase n=2 Tax=Hymenobacter TaxID=89966 RepID=A0A7W9T4Q3_9BACT|nr:MULTISPECIES: N-acetylmuramic acid 6-phosphate etherase [Hymenobacter]MBB4602473.1 N-acetylmuramic acid 6-phosphate etherase [Hymenobacter latericoloratus]MBB6060364.1 N-acetylmuramic acid 6-phosphate etherase [Hymenobacter luteus]
MSTTESSSLFNNLETLSTHELLTSINSVDQTVPMAVAQALPQIEALVEATVARLGAGGRLFYIGAGTSGRLGILDASECPPTFGVPHGVVIGLIAGGDTAIRKAVENAEDDAQQAWLDLQAHHITEQDIVVGIAASGRTPYVIGGLQQARQRGVATGCIVCNAGSEVAAVAEFPVEVVTGPEFVTGSTRLKAGTAQKLVLNMLTTATFIRLGRVKGNKMVDMQLSNAKLVDRGERMLMDELHISQAEAADLLRQHGSVRAALAARAS